MSSGRRLLGNRILLGDISPQPFHLATGEGRTLSSALQSIAILTTFSPARLGAICRRKPRDRTANIPPTSSSQRPASPDALHSKREYLSDTLQAICLHQPIMQSKSKPCISTAFHTTLRALAPFSGKSHFDCLRNLRKSFHKLNVRPSLMRRHICSDPPLQLCESRIFTQKRGGEGVELINSQRCILSQS
jgi:hypothetical protein